MADGKSIQMDYNVCMSPKEEKRRILFGKARYFMAVLLIYICVYLVFYLVFSLIHALFYLHPYFRLFMLALFFFLSSAVTAQILKLNSVRSFLEVRSKR